MAEKTTGKPPVQKIRFGGMSVSIWENENKDKQKFHTITMERSYKDKDDAWNNTQTLRHSDLPKAILVLQKAYEAVPELFKTDESKEE